MRARILARELRQAGHELLLTGFGRAAALLREQGFEVLEVRGLTCSYEGGAVRRGRTLLRAVSGTPARLRHNARIALEQVRGFRPDVALTDFSGFAYYARLVTGCPIISIDHQHVIDRFHHPRELTAHFKANFALARATVTAKTPGCDRFLVTSFYFPDPRPGTEASTRITGPLLRPELAGLEPARGRHVLVYQTAAGDRALLETLRSQPGVEFRVYGAGGVGKGGNLELKSFDERGFLGDLASARAVISNGGFSAISEALYLGKPVLSIPLLHQGEQQLNAAWLARLGLGMRGARLSPELLREFLTRFCDAPQKRDPRLRTGTRDFVGALHRALREVA